MRQLQNGISKYRMAIVHDGIHVYGGAERVLEQLIACFPSADLFAAYVTLSPSELSFLQGKLVATTPFQKLPRLKRWHRHYFVLLPLMIEQLDLGKYDVVISSSYLVAKGVLVGPDQLHISYVHSPMRYAWDMQHEYLRGMSGLKGLLVRLGLHYLRLWDGRVAGVDAFVTNSDFVARRLRRVYNRGAAVIYPPVDTQQFGVAFGEDDREAFFVTVSRLVPYKRVDFLVEAFTEAMPELRLVVIGDGPDLARVRAKAGPNVTVMGRQSHEVVRNHLQRATGFVYAAEEDFGIAAAEAQACGTPVIAYARGGVREIVRGLDHPLPTGTFYAERTPQALRLAIDQFFAERARIRASACRANAERFAASRFRAEFRSFVIGRLEQFRRELDAVEPATRFEPRRRHEAQV